MKQWLEIRKMTSVAQNHPYSRPTIVGPMQLPDDLICSERIGEYVHLITPFGHA